MLSPMDDYPIHQVAEVIRHVGTSDRNFYDRYYFNCHRGDDELFLLAGMGHYPNLGVVDGFVAVRRGDDHFVVRASRALGDDRMDLGVGPLRIEVVEGLRQLRLILEPTSHDLACDMLFTADVPATLEPRHRRRELERLTFDSMRFAQTGRWSGSLTVDGSEYSVMPDLWRGNRDRSWGIRPVGEPEPAGRKMDAGYQNFFWIYSVMQFDDFSIFVIMQEDEQGQRIVEEALRVQHSGGAPEWLGRPEHHLVFAPGGRDVTGATLTFHRPNGDVITVRCELLVTHYLGVGTGYSQDPEWRHGMWQGDLVVQGLRRKVSEFDLPTRMFCPVDNLTRFHLTGADGVMHTGMGLFEVGVIGPHDRYGFTGFLDIVE